MHTLVVVVYVHCTCKIETVSIYLNVVAFTELMTHCKTEAVEHGGIYWGEPERAIHSQNGIPRDLCIYTEVIKKHFKEINSYVGMTMAKKGESVKRGIRNNGIKIN